MHFKWLTDPSYYIKVLHLLGNSVLEIKVSGRLWLVHRVMFFIDRFLGGGLDDHIEHLFERLLIVSSCLTIGELEVYFSEVHTYRTGNHLSEEIMSKCHGHSVSFSGSSGLEFVSIDAVNVK